MRHIESRTQNPLAALVTDRCADPDEFTAVACKNRSCHAQSFPKSVDHMFIATDHARPAAQAGKLHAVLSLRRATIRLDSLRKLSNQFSRGSSCALQECTMTLQLEKQSGLNQVRRFLAQAFCRRGRLFDERRILLRHRVHLRHRARHLSDARALFGRGRRYLRHDVSHPLHRAQDFAHGFSRVIYLPRSGFHFGDRFADQGLDLFRGGRAPLCQIPHFGRHHCKSTALLTRARRLHRCIQRQNVSLKCDAVDHPYDVRYLVRRFRDAIHRAHHLGHHLAATRGNLRGANRELMGLLCVLRVLLYRRSQFLHRTGRLFQTARLLLRPLRQVRVSRRNLLRRYMDRVRGILDAHDDLTELSRRLVGIVFQPAEQSLLVCIHALGQIAARQRTEYTGQIGETLFAGYHERIHVVRDLQLESLHSRFVDTPAEVTLRRRSHDFLDVMHDPQQHLLHFAHRMQQASAVGFLQGNLCR